MLPTARSRRRFLAACALPLLMAAGAPAGAEDPPAARPADLTGVWELDAAGRDAARTLARDALDRLRAAGEAQRPGPAGQRRSAGRPGGAGRFQGIDGGRPEALAQAPTARRGARSPGGGLRSLARDLQRLLITHDGPRVEILDGSDRAGIWTPGGPQTERNGPGGGTVREQAWWEGDILVLQRRGERFTLQQRLRRDPQDGALVVEVAVTVGDDAEPIRARLVYRGA